MIERGEGGKRIVANRNLFNRMQLRLKSKRTQNLRFHLSSRSIFDITCWSLGFASEFSQMFHKRYYQPWNLRFSLRFASITEHHAPLTLRRPTQAVVTRRASLGL